MGDTSISYSEQFGFHSFKREVCAELGESFWQELTEGLILPDLEHEAECQCRNMRAFMQRLETMADIKTVQRIFCRVRHGLHPSQSAWARQKFLEAGDLDMFLKELLEAELAHFLELNREHRDFYGQEITDEVLEFIKQNPSMLAPIREGNKLHCKAFPSNMDGYLNSDDPRQKRYHACHCPLAKESILSDAPVSATLCHCSLGHVMNFTEAFLDRNLEGRVVRSVLNGDLTCEYEITIPDDIVSKYIDPREKDIIIQNYYRYYRAFTLSGIVGLHEGPIDWIMPDDGEHGPSLAFHIHLDENQYEQQLRELIAGIRMKAVPQRWVITPDATPVNIVPILETHGFRNLSKEAPEPEPGMLLRTEEFRPYRPPEGAPITCKRVQTCEEFATWIDVVNTALHGWPMISADHYFKWVETNGIQIYLAEIDGIAVSTAATMRDSKTASLEFVSTLPEYRRQKAALTLCSTALSDLFAQGVKTVTLSGASEAVALYEKLGFRAYFSNVIMLYEMQDNDNERRGT